ncbi:hypothetical protein SAY86_029943 [Trapa natans]|uniref:Uncharacterized protein n=1 Tax=Trapa natans TaxID=22666 RepID=A0AAN7MF94_TRANT|nr:hypothetical protein SAY86_029943 [Trapa natans]
MSKLRFEEYTQPLPLYLHRYTELEGDICSLRSDSLLKRPTPVTASVLDYGHGHIGIKPRHSEWLGSPCLRGSISTSTTMGCTRMESKVGMLKLGVSDPDGNDDV